MLDASEISLDTTNDYVWYVFVQWPPNWKCSLVKIRCWWNMVCIRKHCHHHDQWIIQRSPKYLGTSSRKKSPCCLKFRILLLHSVAYRNSACLKSDNNYADLTNTTDLNSNSFRGLCWSNPHWSAECIFISKSLLFDGYVYHVTKISLCFMVLSCYIRKMIEPHDCT